MKNLRARAWIPSPGLTLAFFLAGSLVDAPAQSLMPGPQSGLGDFLSEEASLLTRSFQVDPAMFTPAGSSASATVADTQAAVRKALLEAGLNLQPGAFHYNERTKVLLVRAREEELRKLEEFLVANRAAPTVRFEVRMAEFPSESEANQKIESLLTNLEGGAARWDATQEIAVILTEPERAQIFEILEENEGVSLLTFPAAKTISGRQARIAIEGIRPVTIPPFYAPR